MINAALDESARKQTLTPPTGRCAAARGRKERKDLELIARPDEGCWKKVFDLCEWGLSSASEAQAIN
jgi:hypothetical protein